MSARSFSFVMILGLLGVAIASPSAAREKIATAWSNLEGVEIDLWTVERKGSVLTVKWAVRLAEDAAKARITFALAGKVVTTYVVDEDSGTKYYVLTDKEGNSLASEHVWVAPDTYGISDDLEPGKTRRYWGKFPAPPPEVESVSLFFTEAEPLEDVAILDK